MALGVHTVTGLGQEFRFFLENEGDHVQGELRAGHFYEAEELDLISEYAKDPRRILDVGANIGNHSVFFAHKFNPDRLVSIEPNPDVLHLLKANLGMNWHKSMDLTYVGAGLSDRPGRGESQVASAYNIGGAKLVEKPDGRIPIYCGDEIFPIEAFDLIKIDVEGMEFRVLEGLSSVLQRSRGIVFLEVLIANIDQAVSMLRSVGFEYQVSYQRYGRCINLLFEK